MVIWENALATKQALSQELGGAAWNKPPAEGLSRRSITNSRIQRALLGLEDRPAHGETVCPPFRNIQYSAGGNGGYRRGGGGQNGRSRSTSPVLTSPVGMFLPRACRCPLISALGAERPGAAFACCGRYRDIASHFAFENVLDIFRFVGF